MILKILLDICPWALSVPQGSQFSLSFALLSETVHFSEQIMFTDKYPCLFSCRKEAIVYVLFKFILDTWSFLCSAYKVQTSCHNMVCSPASGKMLVDCQLVEVISSVNAVLIHLQLVTYGVYSSLP